MTEPLTVREATVQDVAVLVDLINAAFKVEEFFKEGDRTSAPEIHDRMRTGTFMVALESGRIVGAVFVDRHETVGHYAMLAIDPARQKAGIGRTLMKAAEEWCRAAGCREVEIEVVNLREELPPFYRRFGYVETGTRPFPAHFDATRPCHFVVWRKALT